MAHLEYVTAGESHGPGMIAIVSGLPSDVPVDGAFIDGELARRQGGFGRSGRMGIEHDRCEFLAGVRKGLTTGAPVAMLIRNMDSRLDDEKKTPPVHRPRPGHADLAGALKFSTPDCRNVIERASARETAARTAAGALVRCMLHELGIEIFAFVRAIAGAATRVEVTTENWRQLRANRDASETMCPDPDATARQVAAIRAAKHDKDTVGGIIEAHVFGCPPGVGSCMVSSERLDARLAGAVMSVQAIKSVEIGMGWNVAEKRGSEVHDPIDFDPGLAQTSTLGFVRVTNHAGGIEGGMSNGQPIVIRAAMKPISTLLKGIKSIDLRTKAPEMSQYERSDICAVPAASVVIESVVAFEVARSFREKFGGDCLGEVMHQLCKLRRQR